MFFIFFEICYSRRFFFSVFVSVRVLLLGLFKFCYLKKKKKRLRRYTDVGDVLFLRFRVVGVYFKFLVFFLIFLDKNGSYGDRSSYVMYD